MSTHLSNNPDILYKSFIDDTGIKDKISMGGSSKPRTHVVVTNPVTGEVIFEGSNKVIFPGSEYSAKSLFDLSAESVVSTYSEMMGLDQDAVSSSKDIAGAKNKIYLFCIGTDGCGPEASQKYPVNYTKAMLPADLVDDPTLGYMVPFRFMNTNNALDRDGSFRSKYFGRRLVTVGSNGGTWIAYYFKKFETEPILVRSYVDGTNITKDSNIYHSSKNDEAQCYVQLKLRITNEDCRDYFALTVGSQEARWNSISLCTALPATYTANGVTYNYFKDITPYAKLNIGNESMIDTEKQWDISYQLYF